MKILALLTDAFGGYGGIAQYNRDFTTALASLESVESVRILPRLASPRETGRGRAEGAGEGRLLQLPASANRLTYSLRALKAALQYKPTHIFCGHIYMAPLAWLLATVLRKPWWLQIHGIEAWEMPSRLIRFAAERADMVTAVSRYTRRRFLAWANILPERVFVLPNTYDAPAPGTASKSELKERYGLAGRTVLLTVSRIDRGDRYKGHDKVLAVLPALLKTHCDLMYLIAGDGDDRADLEARVREMGLADSVRFTGRVSREELNELYRLADVYVMPSTKEGFGIVFLEAAAHGVPVIGGNGDGSVDALAEGAIGVSLDPESSNTLADAIDSILSGESSTTIRDVNRFNRNHFARHLGAVMSSLDAFRLSGA